MRGREQSLRAGLAQIEQRVVALEGEQRAPLGRTMGDEAEVLGRTAEIVALVP